MMDLLYLVNYFVFATFLTAFAVEVGMAVLSLVSYERNREVIRRSISLLWGPVGTLGVFYLVNFQTTYPKLLFSVASLYEVPLLLAALFMILRNAFVIYSEYAGDRNEKRFTRIYGISTLAVAFLIVSTLTSGVGGFGVSLQGETINLGSFFLNLLNLFFFAGIALSAVFIAGSRLKLERTMKRVFIALAVIAYLLFLLGIGARMPYLLANLYASPLAEIGLVFSLLLFAIAVFSLYGGNRLSFPSAVAWFFFSVMLFGALQYPYIFGQSVNLTNELTDASVRTPILLITAAVYLLLILVSVIFLKIRGGKGKADGY